MLVSSLVSWSALGDNCIEMATHDPHRNGAALAAPLTQELLARAGIVPGMRVLVLGAGDGDVALLVAERVGTGGRVVVLDPDDRALAGARAQADEQYFEDIEFREESLATFAPREPFDAVVGRFFFMHEAEPVAQLERAATFLRPGGRMVVHEWHLESILWPHTSAWPDGTAYRPLARASIDALRRNGVHVDMGLRLVNLFAAAGLPLPSTRSELVVVPGASASGPLFFRALLRELKPAEACPGVPAAERRALDLLAQRLEDAALTSYGHIFLPLQVGAWTHL
jgi:SAM-dependent methyltransferase